MPGEKEGKPPFESFPEIQALRLRPLEDEMEVIAHQGISHDLDPRRPGRDGHIQEGDDVFRLLLENHVRSQWFRMKMKERPALQKPPLQLPLAPPLRF